MVLTYNSQPAKEWNLKSNVAEADGDSLSYQDMMERNMLEEQRRHRERAIMDEGRALWQAKKREQLEVELKDQIEMREQAHLNLFGKPGHGAPTENIRKKKFTEYQLSEAEANADVMEGSMDDSVVPITRPTYRM